MAKKKLEIKQPKLDQGKFNSDENFQSSGVRWQNRRQLDARSALVKWSYCRYRWVWSTKPTEDLQNWDIFVDTSWGTQICVYNAENQTWYCSELDTV